MKIMKQFIGIALLMITQLAFSQPTVISFEIEGLDDPTVYIGYHYGKEKYLLDTLESNNGHFTLKAKRPAQGVYFVYTPDYYFEFIMEHKAFSMRTSIEGGYQDLTIKGSRENELFRDFQIKMGSLQRQQSELLKSLKGLSEGDSLATIDRIKAVNTEMDQYRKNLIAENEGLFVPAFLKLMKDAELPAMDSISDPSEKKRQQYLYHRQHFVEEGQLADGRLLRTPVIHAKVMKYFEKVLIQHPDSIIAGVDWFFEQIGDNPESFRYWLVTLFKKYAESKVMGMDAVMIHLIEEYYLSGRADWISEEYKQQLQDEVALIKPNLIGKPAPRLNVVDTLMQPFYLNQLSAEYTLVFIYDPDCGHCKKTIKKMEQFDSQMSQLGIAVVAVCTTTDVKRWKEFVSNSNPSWHHVIDPTGKSYFRVTYNVRSTPQVYLLDGEKTIIAKRLDIEQFVDLAKRLSN